MNRTGLALLVILLSSAGAALAGAPDRRWWVTGSFK